MAILGSGIGQDLGGLYKLLQQIASAWRIDIMETTSAWMVVFSDLFRVDYSPIWLAYGLEHLTHTLSLFVLTYVQTSHRLAKQVAVQSPGTRRHRSIDMLLHDETSS